ncbi:hypothetical protein [Leuconostoc citreum]|uniref:hypothetical protein n=1 Tax=Leuconostoc citreum TaxID=33964 RepID=UPI0032DE6EA4
MSDYTVIEIAQLGLKKFEVDGSYEESLKKYIRDIIKKEQDLDKKAFEVVAHRPSQLDSGNSSKRPADAYSEYNKDRILNDLAFNYLKERSSNTQLFKDLKSNSEYEKIAKNSNYKYQNEEMQRMATGEFSQQDQPSPYDVITIESNCFVSKRRAFIAEALYSIYLSEKNSKARNLEQEITLASNLANILRSKFLREKIFERHFKFDVQELIEDLNEMNYIELEVSGEEVRLSEKIQNWRNYIHPKMTK